VQHPPDHGVDARTRSVPQVTVSFEDWMSLEGPALKRAAILMCRSEHEADDLVQETFVKLYPKWARIADLENPAAYARRTLTNVYLSRWRRLRLDRSKIHLLAGPDSRPSGVDAVNDRAALTMWLEGLGAKQRTAVVWRYYCDLSVPEIAALMGCQESTVRTQLARALANLRRLAASDHKHA
jgi:RNA polymerase sigma-70 factor (sigma-E family)